MELTIVIPFFNGFDTIEKLASSVSKYFPVIVVDDVSDRPLNLNIPNCTVQHLNNKRYFSGAVNFGISSCKTDILILNQDSVVEPAAFEFIAENRSEYALIGDSISGAHPAWQNGYVQGTFMFMRRDAIDSVGLLDEVNYPLWGSTCEWQLRACRKGFRALPAKVPGYIHLREGSTGSGITTLLRREHSKRGLLIRTPPMISVIVPCYNHGKYIPDLLASLIGGQTSLGHMSGQTLQSFEIIIVDDHSTDESMEILNSVKDPWKGIHVFSTSSNGGTSVACNVAIRNSHAPVIARIDGDDMRESKSLELLYSKLQEDEASFVFDDVVTFIRGQRNDKVWKMPDAYPLEELLYKNTIHAGIMLSKKAWKEAGGYPEVMRHGRDDWAFNIALYLAGYCGVRVPYAGYLYRREGQNRTLRNTSPMHREQFLDQLQHLFPSAYRGEFPMGCCGKGRPTRSGVRQDSGGVMDTQSIVAGSEGMSLVEYTGGNYGAQVYYGPFTGTAYVFSKERPVKNVDVRDLHYTIGNGKAVGILDLRDGKRSLFRPYIPQKVESPPVEEAKEEPTEISSADTSVKTSVSHKDVSGIPEVTATILRKMNNNGIFFLDDLDLYSSEQLVAVLGITKTKADKIKQSSMDLR